MVVQALANSSQRRNLLQELFADIALEVDDRAKGEFETVSFRTYPFFFCFGFDDDAIFFFFKLLQSNDFRGIATVFLLDCTIQRFRWQLVL